MMQKEDKCVIYVCLCLEPALAHRQGFKNTHVMTDLRIKRCLKKRKERMKRCVLVLLEELEKLSHRRASDDSVRVLYRKL